MKAGSSRLASLGALSLTALGTLGVASTIRPLSIAHATPSCTPAFVDQASDASVAGMQQDQLDIVEGDFGLTSTHTVLRTVLTIKNLSKTVPSGSTSNQYVMSWTFNGTEYGTQATVDSSGNVAYSVGTVSGTTFTANKPATGSFGSGAGGQVEIDAPLADIGNPAIGQTLTATGGFTAAVTSGPSITFSSIADQDGPGNNYTLGSATCIDQGGGPTPTPTISPSGTPTPTATATATATAGPCDSTVNLCFGAPVVLPQSGVGGNHSFSDTCYNPCGEPSLAVSPADGTLWVSTPRTIVICCNTIGSPVWKSSDNGTTWSNPIFPSLPGGNNPLTGGDTELAVDKRGTVYEGELWLGSDSIYVSQDKGATWTGSPASHSVGADREWFVYSPSEDAIYGWWDGFSGLKVAKAMLNTAAGSNTALNFTQERIAVPEWVDCPLILTGPCVPKPGPVPDQVNGIPYLPGDSSPGRPSWSPTDHTLYFPFDYQVAGKGVGIASTSDGVTFNYSYVTGAGGGAYGDVGSDWPVTAVDAAGNLYAAWVEDKGDGFNVYLSASADKGATWIGPTKVSHGISATAVFPNLVAGAAGQVALSWFGTSNGGNPNSQATSLWDVNVVETQNALSATPSFKVGTAQRNFHLGNICTFGTGCTGNDRMLLDFFDMKFDAAGALGVVYARDRGGPQQGNGNTEIAFSRQIVPSAVDTPEAPLAGDLVTAGVIAGGLALLARRRRSLRRAIP